MFPRNIFIKIICNIFIVYLMKAAANPFSFTVAGEDPLQVLTSTAPVAAGAAAVSIDPDAVRRLAPTLAGAGVPSHREDELHCTFLPSRRFLNYLLALEALNFSFWDEEPRWRVVYQGVSHDGYWALAAAFRRAIEEEGLPLWDARFLAGLEEDALRGILRGEGRPPPLLESRTAHLREAGRVLLERWGGEFAELAASCGGDAVELVRRIVVEFPSFRDEASWRGRSVRFYKRAQICVADLARLLPDNPPARLTGLEKLTAFADYKVPQVLRKEGILVFAPELARRVDRLELLPEGGEEEVEIRAATVWACEWIARALLLEGVAPESAPRAAEVDYLLWSAGQEKAGLPPYHRTRTIYY